MRERKLKKVKKVGWKTLIDFRHLVPMSDIANGYKLKGDDYVILDKKEIASAKPVSSKLIGLDKFIEFFQVDPHYFERSFLLIPNNSEKPYALLRKVLEITGLAAIGKVTMSAKERVVLIRRLTPLQKDKNFNRSMTNEMRVKSEYLIE